MFFENPAGAVLQTVPCPIRAKNFLLFQSKTQATDLRQLGEQYNYN